MSPGHLEASGDDAGDLTPPRASWRTLITTLAFTPNDGLKRITKLKTSKTVVVHCICRQSLRIQSALDSTPVTTSYFAL
jgi:hypothetical protein